MNILITAGGTTEKIDEVRSVTNTGTGRLGALIAERFAASDDVSHIFYVCAARSARPKGEKTEVRVADDTRALERAVRELCADRRIDAVIHGMAVSDYRVRTVSTSKDMARFIADAAPGGIGVP
ncbi:MAG: phosphopantothenate--cysteine ligase, partial [Clostridiales Family XIII bacterium]|nr:phosphopantothenate--cysteine ligase [Clostridiales Family XIII bacterium]